MEWKFYPPNTAPKPLDIIWCRFPLVEDPAEPGPKARPALVRLVKVRNNRAFVEVAYGTSKMTNYSATDLIIANSSDLTEMGLPQMTVFQLKRIVTIPWAEEWVGVLGDRGPTISRLNAKYREYLVHLQQRLGTGAKKRNPT